MGERGQGTTELIISMLVLTGLLGGAARVLQAQWNRAKCAHQVFEATHSALVGGLPRLSGNLRVWQDAESFHGRGRCGDADESVTLLKVEAGS